MEGITWEWVPGIRVGPFVFESNAEDVVRKFGLIRLPPDCRSADWITFEIPGYESRVLVEAGKIVDVLCADELKYQDVNLLGMPLEEIRRFLGPEEELEENAGLDSAAHYPRLGLTLWLLD